MDKKRIQFGNEGEELVPGVTENLSSSLHAQGDAAAPSAQIDHGVDQRGARASFDRRTGEVHGSGANTGGGGAPGEDYDQDTAGGGVKPERQVPPRGQDR
jgi:hypothetical protein